MKTMKVECPACRQPIEGPREMAGRTIACPTCAQEFTIPFRDNRIKRGMLLVTGAIIAVVALLLLASPGREPSESKIADKLRGQGERRIIETCSNDVVGISRILKVSFDGYGEMSAENPRTYLNPRNWTGEATVDYVNKAGGIERTNLHFAFGKYQRDDGGFDLTCYTVQDPEARAKRR